jgi:hypothetical protein
MKCPYCNAKWNERRHRSCCVLERTASTLNHHFSSNTRPHGPPPWALKMSAVSPQTPSTIHLSDPQNGARPSLPLYHRGHSRCGAAQALARFGRFVSEILPGSEVKKWVVKIGAPKMAVLVNPVNQWTTSIYDISITIFIRVIDQLSYLGHRLV